ncbi:hypothetical protein [Bradyrhizobium japonicum]|uniref:hypothetical protein n=1 Tax=Bradyrhizobium japonicum TaxID=375 RepID=UPI0027152765|nr:hypothetical protein [Bradyrhizobium japonicum]WLB56901.1 hypothetical protein QIH94_13245 [Bradyrhizobium japonicum]WLB61205.1 hypothetical protein QIH96_32560 [Bradyrhizobium japonicum]
MSALGHFPTPAPQELSGKNCQNAVVLFVDYWRAPEISFPKAGSRMVDGLAAVREVFARIAEFGGGNKHTAERSRPYEESHHTNCEMQEMPFSSLPCYNQ